MSEKISNLPVATDVIGADVPVVQGGVNKKAASTLFATTYDADEIVFGDGATAGGVTSSNLTWNETNKQFQAGDVLGAGNGLVTFLDDLNDFWYVGDSVTSSLYYAGANSGGIGAPLTGLGIDIVNDTFTLGNPLTVQLTSIGATNVHTWGFDAGAGNTNQYLVGIGYQAGKSNTGNSVVAIGTNAGVFNGANEVIAIGTNAANTQTGVTDIIAIGNGAGQNQTGNDNIIGIGNGAAIQQTGLSDVIAIGSSAAATQSGTNIIGIGKSAASTQTGLNDVIGIGNSAAQNSTGANVIAIGNTAANGQSGTDDIIAIGRQAAQSQNGSNVIAIGFSAAQNQTGLNNVIAIGQGAAQNNTFSNVVALGQSTAPDKNNQFILAPTTEETQIGASYIRSTALHNNALPNGTAVQQDIRSGTYTPTLTAVLNVTATTARKCQWMRVGNVITVSGQFDVTPTVNNSATKIGIELPVASVFTTAYECAGTGHCTDTSANHHGASVYGDVANARAELSYYESHGTADTFTFTFTYEVI